MENTAPIPDKDTFIAKIKSAPTQPGCYLYYDKHGFIIYVGKAKNLRSRVKSYFTAAATQDERLEDLLPQIVDVEFRVVASELDALILEYHLIKQHKPWFNSAMKPDKQRPYLRISAEDPYPTMSIAAERLDDGARYYDCFTDDEAVKWALGLLARVWHTAQCGKASFSKKASPCMYHSMGVCMAPCAHQADSNTYADAVQQIQSLFDGRPVPIITELKEEMSACAENLDFERAGQCKQLLDGLARLQRYGQKMFHLPEAGEMLVLIRPFRVKEFAAFYVRNGAVMARNDLDDLPDEDVLRDILAGWRALDTPLDNAALMGRCLTDISAQKIFIPFDSHTTTRTILLSMKKLGKMN